MSFLSRCAAAISSVLGLLASLIIPALADSICSEIISPLIKFLRVLAKSARGHIGRFCKKEANFRLYTHQIPEANDVLTVTSNCPNDFGAIRSDDWPLLDGREPNAAVVGRVQGHHIKGNAHNAWVVIFNIIFQDDIIDGRFKFKGSSLAVRGPADYSDGRFEWAIVGGTGELTLAEGVVYGNAGGPLRELCFRVFYRPIDTPDIP